MSAPIPRRIERLAIAVGSIVLASTLLTGAAPPDRDDPRSGGAVGVTVQIGPWSTGDQPDPGGCAEPCDDGSLAETGGGEVFPVAMLAGGLAAIAGGLVATRVRGRRRN